MLATHERLQQDEAACRQQLNETRDHLLSQGEELTTLLQRDDCRILSLGFNVGKGYSRQRQAGPELGFGQSCVTSTTILPTLAECSAHCPGYVSLCTGDLHMFLYILGKKNV